MSAFTRRCFFAQRNSRRTKCPRRSLFQGPYSPIANGRPRIAFEWKKRSSALHTPGVA